MEGNFCEGKLSYYSILGVCQNASDEEIRRAYRKLAMQWHPDKWTKTPYLLGKAKQKFQQIQEAYSVLSDKRKRIMYDTGLLDHDEEEDEGLGDFLQEIMSLVDNVRKENKVYSLEELQNMLSEMAQSFETSEWSSYNGSPQWFQEPFAFNCSAAAPSFNCSGTPSSNRPGTLSNVPKRDGENSFESLVRDPCSNGGKAQFASAVYQEAWRSTSPYAF